MLDRASDLALKAPDALLRVDEHSAHHPPPFRWPGNLFQNGPMRRHGDRAIGPTTQRWPGQIERWSSNGHTPSPPAPGGLVRMAAPAQVSITEFVSFSALWEVGVASSIDRHGDMEASLTSVMTPPAQQVWVAPVAASWLDGPRSSIGASAAAVVGGAVAKCVTGTLGDGRDVAVRVDLLAWDGVRQGRRPAPSETCVGVLITRRSQVQILPPLPTRQRYYRRSTARKSSLRAVFVSAGGVHSDQIPDQGHLVCPAASYSDVLFVGRPDAKKWSIFVLDPIARLLA